jgi:HD-GYP domain-containing protein (c-di-GMP phosphodiesterase class II)
MNFLLVKNKKVVLISEKVRSYIAIPADHDYVIKVSADLQKDIQMLKDDKDKVHILAVIFLHADEHAEMDRLRNAASFTDFSCQYVIFGDEKTLKSRDFENVMEISELRHGTLSEYEFNFVVRKTFTLLHELYLDRSLQDTYLTRLIDTKKDQDDLITIGRALSIEKDPEKLLRTILDLSKRITGADAGSIFLVEQDDNGKKSLRFKYSHTHDRDIRLEKSAFPIDKRSISGYVAVTGEILNIPDAYNLPPGVPYSFNSTFDKKNNYISRSMLVVPMKNHMDEIIGVIQLINSKESLTKLKEGEYEAYVVRLRTPEDFDRHVVTFHKKYNSLMEAVAGQAAIAIENNRMIMQIQNQFEEFVKASVSAIESRDPATSGHSFRVADVCTALARAVNDVNEGYLKEFHFTETQIKELELAALLHDFGKVYIDLSVFKKSKKLYPKDFENLCLRLNYLYRVLELQYASREAELLTFVTRDKKAARLLNDIMGEKKDRLRRIMEIKDKLSKMNEPAVVDENLEETLNRILSEIDEIECITMDGDRICIISPVDKLNLSIRRGSLNPVERKEIESHVSHTYDFVSKIPWPPEYKNIPEIALRHHEKLDGTGYPGGLKGRESTLLQSRIMAIADIFDALAAGDRPYKDAVPLEHILAILKEEADKGVLDSDLVNLFIDRRIYERISKDSFKNYVQQKCS